MDRDSLDFLDAIFPQYDDQKFSILIINQSLTKKIISDAPGIRVINTTEKGLSRSRNLALKNSSKKLCVLTDDDIVFLENFEEKIIQAFTYFKDAAVIRFRAEKSEGVLLKKYPSSPIKNISWLDILNTASIEIVVKPQEISKEKVFFDEEFGLGSVFTMGEEQVFLGALKKSGLQLSYYPETLNRHESPTSIQKIPFQERYKVQGAMTYAMFKRNAFFWLFLKIFFDIKQGGLHFKNLREALRQAKQGRIMYVNLKK